MISLQLLLKLLGKHVIFFFLTGSCPVRLRRQRRFLQHGYPQALAVPALRAPEVRTGAGLRQG